MLIIQILIRSLIRVTLSDFMQNLLVSLKVEMLLWLHLFSRVAKALFQFMYTINIKRWNMVLFFVRSKENFISVARQM